MPAPRLRPAVRAIIVDEDERVLLVQFSGHSRWACPGGGIEPGESPEAAIRRELEEEAGLTDVELGPVVWRREHVFPLSERWDGQAERFYLVRTPAFEARPRLTAAELAAEGVIDMRWWTLDELSASTELFAPRQLPGLLTTLLASGPLEAPLDVGL